jgi:hypothetical protein
MASAGLLTSCGVSLLSSAVELGESSRASSRIRSTAASSSPVSSASSCRCNVVTEEQGVTAWEPCESKVRCGNPITPQGSPGARRLCAGDRRARSWRDRWPLPWALVFAPATRLRPRHSKPGPVLSDATEGPSIEAPSGAMRFLAKSANTVANAQPRIGRSGGPIVRPETSAIELRRTGPSIPQSVSGNGGVGTVSAFTPAVPSPARQVAAS